MGTVVSAYCVPGSFDIEKYLVPNLDQGPDEGMVDEELDEASPFSTTPTGRSMARREKKQRARTEKQQELNKQAQQRYR